MHKYRADGALGSSWHPYVHGTITAPPIQEDETAMVVFMFAQFYQIQQDGSLIRDFYQSLIVPMAEFLSEYTDHSTGLPKPSYDLWEEVFMTTTYSTAVTYAALLAASELATTAGDDEHAVKWRTAANDIQEAAQKHLFNDNRQGFYKGVISKDGALEKDETIDASSVFGAYMYGLFDADSDQMKSAIQTVKDTFDVSRAQPGVPRYEDDKYRRQDKKFTGNWWPIATLWLAQYEYRDGTSDFTSAALDWVKDHAVYTMISEQINPLNSDAVSPAPLTWSHAEYLSTWLDIIEERS